MLKYFLELRNKFILLLVTFLSTLMVCYYYKDALLFLITQMHLNDTNLYFIFTNVTELFSIYLQIVSFFTVQVIIWYFFYHLFFFLATALYTYEFKFISFVFGSGTFFWFLSALLSSYIIIPYSWNFFLSFQFQEGFYFEARINDYFKFYIHAYALCLIYFQMFIILFIFLVDVSQNYYYIKKYRKLYYYIFLILATLMTPPDLISQIFTTFFLIIVYETVLLLSLYSFYLKLSNLVTS
jgi:sec-independent protein translocase protein TatC